METIIPASEADWLQLRTKDVTSTEVSALFGCSPYLTRFDLWHRKKSGVIVEFTATERTEWGLALQDAIAARTAKLQGWTVRRMDEYIRVPELRMGSSFDFEIIDPALKAWETVSVGLLEIKNVDTLQFKDRWLVDGDNIEAPIHIELQVQHQLAVSDRSFAYIGALIGGNSLKLVRREPIPDVISAIKTKVSEFWQSIDEDREPSPVFPQDAETVIRLSQYAEPGKVIIGTDDVTEMAKEYKRLGDEIKERDALRETIKAELLLKIGDAEKVKGEQYTISAGITGEAEISYTRKAFRNFRISWRGEKSGIPS